MDKFTIGPDAPEAGANWVRQRTLILLRWTAIAGQVGATLVASQVYGLDLPLGLCALAIGLSVFLNLTLVTLFPENRRLNETETFLTLLFDLTQLSFLILVTGGLTNPFAILVLAPVTISASVLRLRSTITLAALAIAFATLALFWRLPLRFEGGGTLEVPGLFAFGFWLSIVIGVLFLGLYSRRVATEMRSMSEALLATQMALAREQKLTDLAGVVAAAAHELGTPLATIKLASAELIDELDAFPDLRDDAKLIRDQADRCRDILRDMGRAGRDDLHLRSAPLSAVVHEASEPHASRGKTLRFDFVAAPDGGDQPAIYRRPEIIHGLRNLVQNAVDFARSTVWIEGTWAADRITLRITDDGKGYPPNIIGRIGEPFVRARRGEDEAGLRPGYEGMGLGLFIAKTLLERSGAALTFTNAMDPFLSPEDQAIRCGAVVKVSWARAEIEADRASTVGRNPLIPT